MSGVKLDDIDIRILSALQENARITNVLLAEKVGLSASPCLQRVKRLEANGLIRRHESVVDLKALAGAVYVFTEITLNGHRREDFDRFEKAISAEPTVLECHMVSGGFDYLVKFAARHIGHYQEVIESLLDADVGVNRYFSYIVIKTPLESRPPDLPLYMP